MNSISEAEIQGYIDGQIDPESHARVERYIENRPTEAIRIRQAREDMALLRRYFTAVEAHIPDRYIADTVRLIVEHEPPRRRFAHMSAGLRTAAMLAFLLAGTASVLGVKLSTVPAFADAAVLAYQEMARAPADTDENGAPDPKMLIDWLNAKTGLVIHVPHSEQHGFQLMGGRVARFEEQAAGLLVYEDWRHHRVIIFVTRVKEGEDPEPHFAEDHSTYINYWSRDGVGVVIAAADKRDLEEFTRATKRMIDVSALPLRSTASSVVDR